MTLAEMLAQLFDLDDRIAVYAQPKWSPEAAAVAAYEPWDGRPPEEAAGMTFLFRAGEAKREAVATARRLGIAVDTVGRRPRFREAPAREALTSLCHALIYFARYDVSMPASSTSFESTEDAAQ
ncbi:MAG: hypothetical protein AAGA56_02935 [Myxococcota bacterium]